jgi:carbonic anhydrase
MIKENNYQSPISLHYADAMKIKQTIEIYGRNEDSIYNKETKNFEVQKNIIVTLHNKKYRLDEYHFHIPSEHKVNGEIYAAEIHYVFIELDKDFENSKNVKRKCSDICGCNQKEEKEEKEGIIVIGRVIHNSGQYKDLCNIQVKIPHYYFQYDGTLTVGNYSPVRWIIGETPIHYDISQLSGIAKNSRPLQPLDGRIILHTEKHRK